jgi:hypothetical protein
MSKIKIGFYKGSNSGQAIYLGDESGGYRVAGPKCWGFIEPIKEWTLDADDLERLIRECKSHLKALKKKNKVPRLMNREETKAN